MKIFFLFVLIILNIVFFFNSEISAQQTSFDKYIATISIYRDSHNAYLTNRQAYLQFQTLKSKTDAEISTKTMLLARADTILSYLFLLQERMSPPAEFNTRYLEELKTEFSWYEQNKTNIQSKVKLEDLLILSDEFQFRYKEITSLKFELWRKLINFHLLDGYSQNIASHIETYRTKSQQVNNSESKSRIERSLDDTEKIFNSAKETLNQAKQQLITANAEDDQNTIAQKAFESQLEAKTQLQSAINYLIELSKTLK